MSIKLLCFYMVQHMLHQIKAHQFYNDLDSYQQCWVVRKIVEFKDFSRPLSDFPVLFKADLIFKDFSSKPSKFKYFSSLCEPCLCKQFGPRSGPTELRSWSGSKPFDTLIEFLKEFFEKVNFEKKVADDN